MITKSVHNLTRKLGTRVFTSLGVALAAYVEAVPEVEQSIVTASVLVGGIATDILLSYLWKEKR